MYLSSNTQSSKSGTFILNAMVECKTFDLEENSICIFHCFCICQLFVSSLHVVYEGKEAGLVVKSKLAFVAGQRIEITLKGRIIINKVSFRHRKVFRRFPDNGVKPKRRKYLLQVGLPHPFVHHLKVLNKG